MEVAISKNKSRSILAIRVVRKYRDNESLAFSIDFNSQDFKICVIFFGINHSSRQDFWIPINNTPPTITLVGAENFLLEFEKLCLALRKMLWQFL